jgi:hypothetical protein
MHLSHGEVTPMSAIGLGDDGPYLVSLYAEPTAGAPPCEELLVSRSVGSFDAHGVELLVLTAATGVLHRFGAVRL